MQAVPDCTANNIPLFQTSEMVEMCLTGYWLWGGLMLSLQFLKTGNQDQGNINITQA